MKPRNTRLIIAILLSLFFVPVSHAQFLKKLRKSVEEKVANIIVEKTAEKAAETVSESLDKAFDVNLFGDGMSKEKADPDLVADRYDFTWKYSLKITSQESEIVFDYYLNPDAPYFGFTSFIMEDMFTVMDNENNITATFLDSPVNNTGMVTPMSDESDIDKTKDESSQFNFEPLPDKTINGYSCRGVKTTNDHYEMVMYFTNEAEVSFEDIYKNKTTKIPKQLEEYFDPNDKVLMIYMDMKNLKREKESAIMECVGLEEIEKSIIKSDYEFR